MPTRTQVRILNLARMGQHGSAQSFAATLGRSSVARALRGLVRDGSMQRYRYGRSYHYRAVGATRVGTAISAAPVPALPAAPALGMRTFGVEFEVLVPVAVCGGNPQAYLARKLNEAGVACQAAGYTHTTTSYWKLVSDASVYGPNAYGVEVVSPVLSGEQGEAEILRVCNVLIAAGCTVNKSCGMHVHHGAADFSTARRQQIFSTYGAIERLVDSFMAPSRRGSNNTFCMSCAGRNYTDTRYFKVNAAREQGRPNHNTVEFRQHGGTVEGRKTMAWVRFTRAMMDSTDLANVAQQTTLEGLCAALGLSAEDTNYFVRRAARFAGATLTSVE